MMILLKRLVFAIAFAFGLVIAAILLWPYLADWLYSLFDLIDTGGLIDAF